MTAGGSVLVGPEKSLLRTGAPSELCPANFILIATHLLLWTESMLFVVSEQPKGSGIFNLAVSSRDLDGFVLLGERFVASVDPACLYYV